MQRQQNMNENNNNNNNGSSSKGNNNLNEDDVVIRDDDNAFYNDDIYNYKDCFFGEMNNDEYEEDDDNDLNGPLAINNFGHKHSPNQNEYSYNNDDLSYPHQCFINDDGDDRMVDTFFKRVDSIELTKPKKAKIIANYLFGELLGDGSYGKVKECLDTRNLCRRAVKIINLKTIARKIPKGVQNVRKEIRIMKRLNNKNVIKLYDIFEKNMPQSEQQKQQQQQTNTDTAIIDSNNCNKNKKPKISNIATGLNEDPFANIIIEKPPKIYIFMDYCMTSLEKLLKCAPLERLCNWQANFYFKQLIDGLEYLHSIGIIHNDIKPGNLLITCDDTLKICDFSISAELNLFLDYDFTNNDNSDNNTNIGYDYLYNNSNHDNLTNNYNSKTHFPLVQCTPMFQCPEMIDENIDENMIIHNAYKIDIWSCGVTLYQLCTGKLPFDGQTVHQIYENIRSTTYKIQIPNCIDKNLEKLLLGMVNRNPIERWSIQDIRNSEWFKKKHPFLNEELAQWPQDVFNNETNTFRMLPFVQKLWENSNEDNDDNDNIELPHKKELRLQQPQPQPQQYQQTTTQRFEYNNINNNDEQLTNHKHITNNINYNNVNPSTSRTTTPPSPPPPTSANATQTKTYTQATKLKRNNCILS